MTVRRQAKVFSVRIGSAAGTCVLTLHGDLDYDSAVQLQEAADHVLADTGRSVLVVDCTALEFCDSSGIGCLVRVYQRLSARGGVLRLAAVPVSVARVFALTGLDLAIPVHSTLGEAIGAGGGLPASGGEDGPSSLRSVS
ncbi:STAS domain-containing protein [Streptomyces collinus]|uniref:STAS domain-containing protein n=1 Tax=Streptomyces collinus TaxID=42684 RepID=UPI0029426CB1|nr:STAS domain-containing protein [Streptomyces collinus]